MKFAFAGFASLFNFAQTDLAVMGTGDAIGQFAKETETSRTGYGFLQAAEIRQIAEGGILVHAHAANSQVAIRKNGQSGILGEPACLVVHDLAMDLPTLRSMGQLVGVGADGPGADKDTLLSATLIFPTQQIQFYPP